jgi:hypothetical protein
MGQWYVNNGLAQQLLERARLLLRDGEDGPVGLGKKERRELERAAAELDRDWRAGKAIQRKQQLQMMPKSWQWLHRFPIGHFPAVLSPNEVITADWPGRKTAFDIASRALAMELAMVMQRGNIRVMSDWEAVFQMIVDTLNPFTFTLFVYQWSCALGAPNVFQVQSSLVEKLLATDISNVSADDVRPPFPGFYVSMPPGSLAIWNHKTGHHQASLIGVAEGYPQPLETSDLRGGNQRMFAGGRTLFAVFFGEPNERSQGVSDDNITNIALPLNSEHRNLGEVFDEFSGVVNDQPDFLRFMGKSYSAVEGLKLLDQFIANFCLYLSSPNPDIEPVRGGQKSWSAEVELIESRRTTPRLRELKEPPLAALWDVGRNTTKLQRKLPSDIVVRGHWKRQAHGPGRTLRKVIWIEPFIRNATGGDAPGHDYEANPHQE